jgi:hypothetical protein
LLAEYKEEELADLSIEKLYAKLNSYLINNTKVKELVVKQLRKLIDEQKDRCLIYARGKDEAEYWSNELDISIYPNKGHHVITTYHDGTYGVNDLVDYGLIIMRPPEPDKLPQIKGRLDRPGQKRNDLAIHYFYLDETIEKGLVTRLEIASNFYQNYIMPLAQFYKLSLKNQ